MPEPQSSLSLHVQTVYHRSQHFNEWPMELFEDMLCRLNLETGNGLTLTQGGVLHAVSEPRFRWVGWSIASAVLVLALTFMSNRPLG